MRLTDFDNWAQRHHGLLTLRASGLDADSWRRAIRTGQLIEIHRHVARLPGSASTPIQDIHAAVLAGGDGAVASHRSAAMLWGLVDFDNGGGIHITMSNRARNPRLAGVHVHRPTDQQRLAPVQRHRIDCTGPTRTLCDLGAHDPNLVRTAVGAALDAGLVALDALHIAVVEHGQRGRCGIPALRSALADRAAPLHVNGVILPLSPRQRQTLKRNSITSPSWAT